MTKVVSEIFLTQENVSDKSWLDFIFTVNKLNGLFRSWKLYIQIELNQVRYFLETRKEIPPVVHGLGDFLIRKIDKLEKPRYRSGLFYYITNQEKCVLDIFDRYEVKHRKQLNFVEILFLPYCFHNFLSATALYFKKNHEHKNNVNKETGKIQKKERLIKRIALCNIPHVFLSIDFTIHNRFFYKKDAEKYLDIQKSLHLLKSDEENAILKIDTFPYLSDSYYLHTASYDFDKHSLIVGSSGTGKSKFICSFIKNIMKNPNNVLNYKIVVIDPHADMEKDIGGLENTNVIDFKTLENSINLFSNSSENPTASTELILSLFKELIADQYNSKLERVLRHSINLLLSNEQLDFTNLRKLLLEIEYRNHLLEISKKTVAVSTIDFFLSDFNELKSKSYVEAISPIISFIDEMQLLPAFNQQSQNQDLMETIHQNTLTIFSLDQTVLGEKVTKTISGFVMQQLLQLIQSYRFSEHIIFVIDEVAVVENPILKRFLSEARKYNLSLILAQQYFSQISEELRKGIFANVINYYIFRVSKADAILLENNMRMEVAVKNSYKVKLKLLTELNNRECIIRTSSNGIVLPAIKGKTLNFESVPRSNKSQIITRNLIKGKKEKGEKESVEKAKSFGINASISLTDLMHSQATGRKKVKPIG